MLISLAHCEFWYANVCWHELWDTLKPSTQLLSQEKGKLGSTEAQIVLFLCFSGHLATCHWKLPCSASPTCSVVLLGACLCVNAFKHHLVCLPLPLGTCDANVKGLSFAYWTQQWTEVIGKYLGWILKGNMDTHKTEIRKILKSPSLKVFKDSSKNTCKGWYMCT